MANPLVIAAVNGSGTIYVNNNGDFEEVAIGGGLSLTSNVLTSDVRLSTNAFTGAQSFATSITMGEGANIVLGTTTGTKIGTSASQKLGFFNATPIVKPTGVAVTAEAVHAALVLLGLIGA